MIEWRFDQGRLDYFQFDEIKNIAKGLYSIDGIEKPRIENDFIRQSLAEFSERPFFPNHYTVWRNYKRVFGCQMLATEIDGKIVCTEICKILATKDQDIDVDDYLRHFATSFYYPSPVFEGYQNTGKQIFPVIALVKFLIAKLIYFGNPSASFEEICTCLIANEVTGLEPIEFYQKINPVNYSGDVRQARELIRFISQFSFIKWNNPNLFIEVTNFEEAKQILDFLIPRIGNRSPIPEGELLNIGSGFEGFELGELTVKQVNVFDQEFTEGNKIRVTHLRTERSNKLKEFYFSLAPNPHVCNMCDLETTAKYPWVNRLIEVHHLLPLSSPVRVEKNTTSINDVVGLCPNCHRATHKYYSKWLKGNDIKDFRSYSEARHVYSEAKQAVA